MHKQINSILIPVDFSENTSVAISRALAFCQDQQDGCVIHLYHVQRIVLTGVQGLFATAFSGYSRQQVNSDLDRSTAMLDDLKKEIQQHRPGVKVLSWVSFGEPVQESIAKKANQLSVDLILIGKRSHHPWLPFLNTIIPTKLAQATGIPVLTAKPGSMNHDIKTVVVPINQHYPDSKLDLLEALRHKVRPHIRLVVFQNHGTDNKASRQLLLHTFQLFKRQFANHVDYEVLVGKNKARSLLNYCKKVGADVLIVYPGIETQVNSWLNSNISDLLPAESKMQILAVNPN